MPPDFPTDIAYFTRFAKHELARYRLSSAREARERVGSLGGSWSAAELPHRVSQKFVKAALRRHAESVLMRPDQIVAWRGDGSQDAAVIFSQLIGNTDPVTPPACDSPGQSPPPPAQSPQAGSA